MATARDTFRRAYREYRSNLRKARFAGAYKFYLARIKDEALILDRTVHLYGILEGKYVQSQVSVKIQKRKKQMKEEGFYFRPQHVS